MPLTPHSPPDPLIPLVADLDGTLIRTDLLWEHLARLLRRNPFWLLPVVLWWMRGRACLKQQLARRVEIDPASLPYHEAFLAWLRAEKAAGRTLILATASDLKMALPVARHVGLFDEVMASDGKINLRSGNKLQALTAKFGPRGFDYAGNSSADFAVWRGARTAIVVNASRSVLRKAANGAALGPTFNAGYSRFLILRRFLNELFLRSGYLGAAGAGLLLAGAFPNHSVAGLAWIAPALILACAQGKAPGDAFRVGYVAGLFFWLASLTWLLRIPVAGYPVLAWGALSAFVALYFAVWVWLLAGKIGVGTWSRRTLWSLAGAAAWVGLEMVRARFLGGFPWNLLGTSQYELTPLIQIASVTGVYGVSFLIVWTSLSLLSAARAILSQPASRFNWQPEVFLPLTVVALLFAAGTLQLRPPPASDSDPAPWRITLIQPSVPQTLIWDSGANASRFQELLTLTDQALAASRSALPRSPGNGLKGGADLLIWPESALPELDQASYAAITNLVVRHGVWMIFNADDVVWKSDSQDRNDYDVFNAAFLFNPEGKLAGVYHKQKLVIFGEYIPLVRWLPFIKWFTPIEGGYQAGDRPGGFELNAPGDPGLPGVAPRRAVRAAPLICFEDMFPQTARAAAGGGTDFLVNLTNDGWFGEGAEQWQQAASAVFRAVENGLPLVRACNDGVTCWIDGRGRMRQVFRDAGGGIYGSGWMTLDLPGTAPAPTFYNRQGDLFGWVCGMITAGVLIHRIRAAKALRRN